MKGRIDIVHTNDGKKEKIRALIIGVVEFNKFMLRCTNSPSEAALNYQLETLGELAREAEVALSSLNVPVLDAVGPVLTDDDLDYPCQSKATTAFKK